MLLPLEELTLTLEIAKEYGYSKDELVILLYEIEVIVENGNNDYHRLINRIVALHNKKVYKSKTALMYLYEAYLKDVTSVMRNNQTKLVHDHIVKYDVQIEELLRDPEIRNPILFQKRKIDNYLAALDSMFQKEKLLGLHRKNFRVILANKIKQERLMETNVGHSIDMSALTIEEKIELNDLLEKMQGVLTEDSITYIDEIPVEDIDHEEVTVPIFSPMKQIEQTNTHKLVVEENPNRAIHNLTDALTKKFQEIAKQTFDKKGIGKGAKLLNPKKEND